MTKVFQTTYGKITLKKRELDSDFPNSVSFGMFDEDGGYYGEISTHHPDDLTANDIEKQITENIYY